MRKPMPARQLGPITWHRVLSAGHSHDRARHSSPNRCTTLGTADLLRIQPRQRGFGNSAAAPDAEFQGLPVRRITFEGVGTDRLTSFSDKLAQPVGAPLNRENLAQSLRQLYSQPDSMRRLRQTRLGKAMALPWISRHPADLHRQGDRGWCQGRHCKHAAGTCFAPECRNTLH